jgi:hypothetical protein
LLIHGHGLRRDTTSVTAGPRHVLHTTDPVDQLRSGFSIREGNQTNFFIARREAAAHVLVTNATDPRVLVVHPNENSGCGAWFDPQQPENSGLALRMRRYPRAFTTSDGREGVHFTLGSNRHTMLLTSAVLDSARVLRLDSKEGNPVDLAAVNRDRQAYASRWPTPPGWARETLSVHGRKVVLHRTEWNGKPYDMELKFAPGTRLQETERGVLIEAPGRTRVRCEVTSTLPFQAQPRFTPRQMFEPRVLGQLRSLAQRAHGATATSLETKQRNLFRNGLRGLMFLGSPAGFVAGSWRFLTYFGRDTLLSSLLLRDVLSPRARETVLRGVLDRLSPDGNVAHEEENGPFTVLQNARESLRSGQPMSEPWQKHFEYKMIDSQFLLPIAAADYLTDERVPLATRQAFLDQPTTERLLSNFKRVLLQASAHPGTSLEIQDPYVGNWRDSDMGLAGGRYPLDVNAWLVRQALDGIGSLLDSGMVTPEKLPEASGLAPLQAAWGKTQQAYEVKLGTRELQQRVAAYMGSALNAEEREFFGAQQFSDGSTVADFMAGTSVPPELRDRLRFDAVSLDANGKPIPVMNTDVGFELYLGKPSNDTVEKAVKLVELPYPLGLMTPYGPFVANPACSSDPKLWAKLGKDGYHGTVYWSWQSAMLEMGLMRQYERLQTAPDAASQALCARVRGAVEKLAVARRALGPLAESELSTWQVVRETDGDTGQTELRMRPQAFGETDSSETESNALQLWSTVYPGLYLASQRAGVGEAAMP